MTCVKKNSTRAQHLKFARRVSFCFSDFFAILANNTVSKDNNSFVLCVPRTYLDLSLKPFLSVFEAHEVVKNAGRLRFFFFKFVCSD